jgi:hypothetical protein
MIRQNSNKVGDVAETIVVPMGRRSLKKIERDVESGETISPIKRQFPFFIVIITVVQVKFDATRNLIPGQFTPGYLYFSLILHYSLTNTV